MRICSMGPGDYDKEIPWHWNDGTNGVLAPRRTGGCPFGTTPRPVGKNNKHY